MKSATELECVSTAVSLVKESTALNEFRESVINKSFITTAFCFLTEQMIEWRHASLNKTVTYRHLLAILVWNLQVSLSFKIIYCMNNTRYGMVRYDCDEWERSEAGGVNDNERHLRHSPVSSPTEELWKG